MTANLKRCPKHSYYAAGFGTCPECDSKPVILQTSEPQTVTVVRGKQSRGKPPKERKKRTPKPVLVPLAAPQTPPRKVNIEALLDDLRIAGMDTDSAIADGLRTGRVMQAISWQVNYQHVIDYLASKGFAVEMYRFRIVCGGDAA